MAAVWNHLTLNCSNHFSCNTFFFYCISCDTIADDHVASLCLFLKRSNLMSVSTSSKTTPCFGIKRFAWWYIHVSSMCSQIRETGGENHCLHAETIKLRHLAPGFWQVCSTVGVFMCSHLSSVVCLCWPYWPKEALLNTDAHFFLLMPCFMITAVHRFVNSCQIVHPQIHFIARKLSLSSFHKFSVVYSKEHDTIAFMQGTQNN